MRGRVHVITACAVCSVVSLLLFPFNYVSGALLALETLRNGAVEGALVLVGSALAFFIAPVIFFLNFHSCLAVIPREDRAFHPSAFVRGFSWFSLIVFTGMSVLLIFARVFNIPLFGA